MESGIVGAGKGFFVINATGVADANNPQTTPTLDKTYEEILTAYNSGMMPVICALSNMGGGNTSRKYIPFIDINGAIESSGVTGMQFALSNGYSDDGIWCANIIRVMAMSTGACSSTYDTANLTIAP